MVILQKKIVGLKEASLERFVLRARRVARLRGSVNILITSNSKMRSLNLRFRGQNKATDVLSFPLDQSRTRSGKRPCAGEIAISADIAAQNALRLGHPAAAEVRVLALHGILHLAGFDHERDNGQMARKEASLRQLLGLPSTLIERSGSSHQKPKILSTKAGSRSRRTA